MNASTRSGLDETSNRRSTLNGRSNRWSTHLQDWLLAWHNIFLQLQKQQNSVSVDKMQNIKTEIEISAQYFDHVEHDHAACDPTSICLWNSSALQLRVCLKDKKTCHPMNRCQSIWGSKSHFFYLNVRVYAMPFVVFLLNETDSHTLTLKNQTSCWKMGYVVTKRSGKFLMFHCVPGSVYTIRQQSFNHNTREVASA